MTNGLDESVIRIVRLERTCTRLRLWCLVLSVGALAPCLLSSRRPVEKVVEAESFVVLGPDGLIKARLGGNAPMASTGLVLYGSDGRIGAFMTVQDDAARGKTAAAFRLASGGDSPRSFGVGVDDEGSFSRLRCADRSVETYVGPQSSAIRFNGPGEPMSEEWRQAHQPLEAYEEVTRLELKVAGKEPTIEGRNSKGDILFREH